MAHRKNRFQIEAESVLAKALLFGLRFLPIRAAYSLSYVVTGLLDQAVPKLRRVALRNLSAAFPNLSDGERNQITSGVFRTVGRLLTAIARFPSINKENVGKWISYEGLENYHAAKQRGRGVLVATLHLGNWELSAFSHALLTEPMNVMVRPLDNPKLDSLVERRRAMSGNRLIFKKDSARVVLKALKNNEAVGVLIDQNAGLAEGVFVNFFGTPACASVGFVKLAYHSQAAVMPGFALWDEKTRRHVIHFLPEVPLTGDETADTQRIHAIFEDVIRRHPDQWMWIHRRWKTRPEGEAGFY